jgi:hypothetical protein
MGTIKGFIRLPAVIFTIITTTEHLSSIPEEIRHLDCKTDPLGAHALR